MNKRDSSGCNSRKSKPSGVFRRLKGIEYSRRPETRRISSESKYTTVAGPIQATDSASAASDPLDGAIQADVRRAVHPVRSGPSGPRPGSGRDRGDAPGGPPQWAGGPDRPLPARAEAAPPLPRIGPRAQHRLQRPVGLPSAGPFAGQHRRGVVPGQSQREPAVARRGGRSTSNSRSLSSVVSRTFAWSGKRSRSSPTAPRPAARPIGSWL